MISRLLNVAKDQVGAAMVEFAIVLPLLMIVLLGIVQFAIFFYQYVVVENAAAVGVRQFVASRPLGCPSTTNPPATPYTSAVSAIQGASGGLASAQVTMSLSVAGTTCTSDSSCGTALCNAYETPLNSTSSNWSSLLASVTVSYPCLTLLPVGWAPSFCSGGNLTATNTQRVD